MKKPVFAAGASVRQSPLQRIIQRTGRRPTECRCRQCRQQCHTPCLGTPHDILRLIDHGYAHRLAPTLWQAGVLMGVTTQPVPLIQARCLDGAWGGLLDVGARSHCTFLTPDGLCELHPLGLKPTEGRLSHHTIRLDNFKRSKSISWAVVQEWLSPDNADVVEEVIRRYQEETRDLKEPAPFVTRE